MPPSRRRPEDPAGLAFLDDAGVAWVDRPRAPQGWVVPSARHPGSGGALREPAPNRVDVTALQRGNRLLGPPVRLPRGGAFAALPDELLVVVLAQLEPRVLGRLARTCRRLRVEASSGSLWSVLFRRRFPRAYRSRVATLTPARLEHLPWKRSYCEQLYEQWVRRRHKQEEQKVKESEKQQMQARQWAKVGGRGTQRLYNTVYEQGGGSPVASRRNGAALLDSPDESSVRRRASGGSVGDPSSPLERSLGRNDAFFMEQMAANTRQYLKPANKKKFLNKGGGKGGAGAGVGEGGRAGGGPRAQSQQSGGRTAGRPRGRRRPASAAGPPGRPIAVDLLMICGDEVAYGALWPLCLCKMRELPRKHASNPHHNLVS